MPLNRAELDVNAPPLTDGNWYKPDTDTSWQWQLRGTLNETYDVELYDVDLFDTPVETIARLKSAGRKVICYFSAGSSENWREDHSRFQLWDQGTPLVGWSGERWLDIRSANVVDIMHARLDRAVEKGCTGVEPDNVDGYQNKTGFLLTHDDQLAYNRHIANEAHARGLAVGLKNDGAQTGELVAYFDFSLNEQCHAFNECGNLTPFLDAGKPIFNAEYEARFQEDPDRSALCEQAREERIQTLVLPLELDDRFRLSCSL
jgi:hypothetical protein